MSVASLAVARDISEIVHFTTNKGLLGVFYTQFLKARARLAEDSRLEHILKHNSTFRKDLAWLDYVNLSISHINTSFFSTSAYRWHVAEDIWWAVLAFSPEILDHAGVCFATTNNMYTGVQRGMAEVGFEALFAPIIERWSGVTVIRRSEHPLCRSTCEQAEVLYPGEISTQWLDRIYVRSDEHADEVHAQISAVRHRPIEIVVNPDKFI